ncbi:MAG: hypothetical protein ACD_79C01002G0001 [uncultured bacterium]|nr:MAG: hypothetical protein ACD_79C01002G0001 [uncultured bacterium]
MSFPPIETRIILPKLTSPIIAIKSEVIPTINLTPAAAPLIIASNKVLSVDSTSVTALFKVSGVSVSGTMSLEINITAGIEMKLAEIRCAAMFGK